MVEKDSTTQIIFDNFEQWTAGKKTDSEIYQKTFFERVWNVCARFQIYDIEMYANLLVYPLWDWEISSCVSNSFLIINWLFIGCWTLDNVIMCINTLKNI